MELLSRFELETSSLPILLRLFSLIASCFAFVPETVAAQRFPAFSRLFLVYHTVRFRNLILGARMGFVWVSIQTQIWNGLLFDISPTAPISDPSPPPLQGNALAINRNQRYNENNIPISTLNQAEQKGSIIIYNPEMIGQDISALANSAALHDKSCAYML